MTTLTRLPISLEFFPPKTPEGVDKLAAVRQQQLAVHRQVQASLHHLAALRATRMVFAHGAEVDDC